MRFAPSIGLALSIATLASISGTPGTAYAVNANIPGTACHSLNASYDSQMLYSAHTISSLATSSQDIICPLVRSPSSSTAAVNVFVDGYASAGYTIGCTLYSYDYQGNLLGAATFTGNTGFFDSYLSVPGDLWSTATVLCLLPPSVKGSIYDVDVVQ